MLPTLRNIWKLSLQKAFFRLVPYSGVKIMEEDWDNLIMLDACRFDFFQEVNDIKGELEKKKSMGSSTTNWIRRNFKEKYPDTVYVSGNPHIGKEFLEKFIGFNPFYKIFEVWDKGWNEELETVPPKEINKNASIAKDFYPDKRLIIHYQQPHFPSLGEKNIGDWSKPYYKEDRETKWTIDEVKNEYRESLKQALGKVKNLLKHIDGKTIITSDHGEAFGELGIYGHPWRTYIPALTDIPWLVVED